MLVAAARVAFGEVAVSCFFPRSFSRSRSLVNHCFDGQAPWNTIYISKSNPELLTGGLGDGWWLGTGVALLIDACNVGHGRTAKSNFFDGKCCHEITQGSFANERMRDDQFMAGSGSDSPCLSPNRFPH